MKKYQEQEKEIIKVDMVLTNICCDNCKSEILNELGVEGAKRKGKSYYEVCITKEIEYEGIMDEYLDICSHECLLKTIDKYDVQENNEIKSFTIDKEEI